MAFSQEFDAPSTHSVPEGNHSHKQKWSSISQSATVLENLNGCFDCNICLDSCHEPVVTLCGHLYCWPCIYKWIDVESSSFESEEQPRCPVCKAYISNSSLVPLYGRGRSQSLSEIKKPQLDLIIPPRPSALGLNALLASAATSISSNSNNQQNNRSPFQPENQLTNYNSITPPMIGSPTTTTSFVSPTINMVGEIVYAGMFGSSETNMFSYRDTNSYQFSGNASPRSRRQESEVEKSLNRVSIFLFWCIALCLVLF
ncbi:hypothetical protein ACP275_08G190300 [Erythranthe tilingii]